MATVDDISSKWKQEKNKKQLQYCLLFEMQA